MTSWNNMEGSPWVPTEIHDRIELTAYRAHRASLGQGQAWYKVQSHWIGTLAKQYGKSTKVIAAIVAALSPQVSWQTQRKYIPGVLKYLSETEHPSGEDLPHPGFTSNCSKAWMIWDDEDTTFLKGPKVNAFAAALAGDEQAVVVDVHMVDAALGLTDPCEREGIGSLTANRYAVIADAVTSAAPLVSRSPRETQALIWEYQRLNVRGMDDEER